MPAKKKKNTVKEVIHVKNMACSCCIRVIKQELNLEGITVVEAKLGEVILIRDPEKVSKKRLNEILTAAGFEIIHDKEEVLIEQIKQAVTELVHHTTFNAMIRNSDYLVEKFNLSYPYLSSIFSKHTDITLEKYIILSKIEKVKELIEYGELTLSEIAFMMGYSSVQYLSTQFKAITGISVTDYKQNPSYERISLDRLGS